MLKIFTLVFASLLLAACGHGSKKGCCGGKEKGGHRHEHDDKGSKCKGACEHHGEAGAKATQGSATLNPVGKSKASGVIQLATEGNDIRVTYNLKGLKKNQSHGFHIHEFGDCTATDGSSAGGHFNPRSAAHGGPDAATKHIGDLGNVKADAAGVASGEAQLAGANLGQLAGRSFVVHAGPDDMTSQPAGNSGDRIACGVIGVTR